MPALPDQFELPRLREKPHDKRLDNLQHLGRIKGQPNKICRDLKEGLLEGAILHGCDGQGEDGLIGYCHHLAERHPKAYCGLLAKLLPFNMNTNVTGAPTTSINIVAVPHDCYLTAEQIEKTRTPALRELEPPIAQAEPDPVEPEPDPIGAEYSSRW